MPSAVSGFGSPVTVVAALRQCTPANSDNASETWNSLGKLTLAGVNPASHTPPSTPPLGVGFIIGASKTDPTPNACIGSIDRTITTASSNATFYYRMTLCCAVRTPAVQMAYGRVLPPLLSVPRPCHNSFGLRGRTCRDGHEIPFGAPMDGPWDAFPRRPFPQRAVKTCRSAKGAKRDACAKASIPFGPALYRRVPLPRLQNGNTKPSASLRFPSGGVGVRYLGLAG